MTNLKLSTISLLSPGDKQCDEVNRRALLVGQLSGRPGLASLVHGCLPEQVGKWPKCVHRSAHSAGLPWGLKASARDSLGTAAPSSELRAGGRVRVLQDAWGHTATKASPVPLNITAKNKMQASMLFLYFPSHEVTGAHTVHVHVYTYVNEPVL